MTDGVQFLSMTDDDEFKTIELFSFQKINFSDIFVD